MRTHKIAGVDKSICTCEQKIAYNFAFNWYDVGKSLFTSDKSDAEKEAGFNSILDMVRYSLSNEKFEKFNIEAVIEAFKHGFKNYCLNFFIATNYEEIGRIFR